MQTFRPFRATVHRQQKYYSQKRPPVESKGSVFNLPRQIMGQRTVCVINPEVIKVSAQSEHKIASEYQNNLKKNVKKHSVDILNKKTLQKIAYSYIKPSQDSVTSNERITTNNSSQMYPNKNMAFRTLNILYRTIIETKVRRKQKQTFELSAKRLPILQKGVIQPTVKRVTEVFVRNSSFDKYKTNLSTIADQSPIKNSQKYNALSSLSGFKQSVHREEIDKDNDKVNLWGRRKRFQRDFSQRNVNLNEIMPWNQFEGEHEEMGLYEAG